MKKYIFITNIPTPYRSSFYNRLDEMGFDFEVCYQRSIESDRSWDVNEKGMTHSYYIDNGFYKPFGHFHFHFNPRMLWRLLKSKNSDFIFGLNWNDLDLIILVTLKRLKIVRNTFHFWTEANHLTIGAKNDNFIKKVMRQYIFNCADGSHLKSGKMTEVSLSEWKINVERYVPLSNTIEEDVFTLSGNEDVERKNNKKIIFFMPVRLQEKIKGIINFFTAIGVQNIKRANFVIAGGGPDRALIQKFILDHELDEHISLLGYVNSKKMAELYRSANVFLLPSFSDPSPLSVFEAMSMSLPLLISDRCGNHFEAVVSSKNGYVFDPDNHESIRHAYESILKHENELDVMGKLSQDIYWKDLSKDIVINKFISKISSQSDISNK